MHRPNIGRDGRKHRCNEHPDFTDEEKYLSTNLCNRSRPNRLDIKEFKYVIEVLSKLFLNNISNHIIWCGWGPITERDESLHPSHWGQIRFSQNLSSLFKNSLVQCHRAL